MSSHSNHDLSLAEIVQSSDDFNILAKALAATGLDEKLDEDGLNVTVFAPTDEAFIRLARDFGFKGDASDEHAVFDAIAGVLDGLADKEKGETALDVLARILGYHVSPGAKTDEQVAALDEVPTLLEGATFSPDGNTLVDNEPDLKDPKLIATNIKASNGIAHVIDRVLIPVDIEGNELKTIVVEAEDLDLNGYQVEQDADASGDELIKLIGRKGVASTEFHGQAGQYDLKIDYFDEIDGRAKIEVLINGERVERIRLDDNLGGFTATEENATSVTIEGLHLEYGDKIELVGKRSGFEFARIDTLTFTPTEPHPTIAEIAQDNGNFEILLKALAATGLTDPFTDPTSDLTVFAPTDEAFGLLAKDLGFEGDVSDKHAVFQAIGEALEGLAAEHPGGKTATDLLKDILLYHVSPEAKTLKEVAKLDEVETLLEDATFSPDGKTLVDNEPDLTDPMLALTDIKASNGIVHVIDRVLIPKDIPGNEPSLADLVNNSDDFNILAKALAATGLDKTLDMDGLNVTVFAPTDEAFIKLARDFGFKGDASDEHAVFDAIAGVLDGLADKANGETALDVLAKVLSYHVSPEAKTLTEVAALDEVPTLLDGATFSPDGTTLVDNEPDLKDPKLIATDIEASNGIAHVIDRVLIPLDIPGNELKTIVVEAEDLDLNGYQVEQDADASGDELIKLIGRKGVASTEFHGQAGEYDLKIDYFDEIDGRAKIEVLINGERVERIRLDDNLGGFTATEENATSVTIEGLHLEQGDTIELVGKRSGLEFARIDTLTFSPADEEEQGIGGASPEDALV